MFITKKNHLQELNKLHEEIKQLKSIIEKKDKTIQELKAQLNDKIEVEYDYRFPQEPKAILVSPYIAEKFLKNKAKFFLGKYEYKDLEVRVISSLDQYQVLFEAEWKEPPVICKNCGKKTEYEYAYPKDNPMFCDKYCFGSFIAIIKSN